MVVSDVILIVVMETLAIGSMVVISAGIHRIPWRYGFLSGAGIGLVIVAGTLASAGFASPGRDGWLILLAAIGGGVAVRGYERGKARRDALIESIVGT